MPKKTKKMIFQATFAYSPLKPLLKPFYPSNFFSVSKIELLNQLKAHFPSFYFLHPKKDLNFQKFSLILIYEKKKNFVFISLKKHLD